MKKKVIIVVGMHRSGTSMVAGCLALSGIHFGERLLPPASDNRKGFWEQKDLVNIHDRLLRALGSEWSSPLPLPEGWTESLPAFQAEDEITRVIQEEFGGRDIWGVKDPRMCILMPLWLRIFERLQIEPFFIRVLRNPLESAKSLERRNGMPQDQSLALWARYNLDACHPSVLANSYTVTYDDFLNAPAAHCRNILTRAAATLAQAVSEETISQFCDTTLRHHSDLDNIVDGVPLQSIYTSFTTVSPDLEALRQLFPSSFQRMPYRARQQSLVVRDNSTTLYSSKDLPSFRWLDPITIPGDIGEIIIEADISASEFWLKSNSACFRFDQEASRAIKIYEHSDSLLVLLSSNEGIRVKLKKCNAETASLFIKYCPIPAVTAPHYATSFFDSVAKGKRRSLILRQRLSAKDKLYGSAHQLVLQQAKKIDELSVNLKQALSEITELKTLNEAATTESDKKSQSLGTLEQTITEQRSEIANFGSKLLQQQSDINQLKEHNNELSVNLRQALSEITELKTLNEAATTELDKKIHSLGTLEQTAAEQRSEISNFESKLLRQQLDISQLKEHNRELKQSTNEILGSFSWKVTKPLRAVAHLFSKKIT
jgi:hypothetical protein